jgi:hypothetical protein
MSRLLALPAALASLLLLASCGDKQPATVNETGDDSGLAQENVVVGDVTAIDAATADDSGMAEDIPPPAADANELESSKQASTEGNDA